MVENSLDMSEDMWGRDKEEVILLANLGGVGWCLSIRGFVENFFVGLGKRALHCVTLDTRVAALRNRPED